MSRVTIQLTILVLASVLAGCGSPSPGTFRGEPIDTPPMVENHGWDELSPAELWRAVQDQVVAMEIAHRGIEISEEEIVRVIAMKTADSESVLPGDSQYIHHQDAMERALKAWHDAPGESDAIYREMLEPEGISPALWETFKETYPDGERMEKYWQTWDPETASKQRRENTRNQLRRIALAGAIQGSPVEAPDQDWEAMQADLIEETGRDLPRDSLEFEFKAGAAYDIVGVWIREMLGSGELKLSEAYAERIRVWVPGMPTSGG